MIQNQLDGSQSTQDIPKDMFCRILIILMLIQYQLDGNQSTFSSQQTTF